MPDEARPLTSELSVFHRSWCRHEGNRKQKGLGSWDVSILYAWQVSPRAGVEDLGTTAAGAGQGGLPASGEAITSCVSMGKPKPSPRSFPSGAVPQGAPFPIQKQLGGTSTGSRAAAREHSSSPANQQHPHHVFPPRGIDFSPFAYSS